MPRPPATPEQKKKTRNLIRAAASRLIAKHRLQDINARAVATEAGVSVGTIYTHFENLAELAQSLWQDPVNELRQKISHDADNTSDPIERINGLLQHYMRFAKKQNAIFKGAFLYVRPDSMKKPKKTKLKEEIFYSYLHDAIIEGQESGQIKAADPHMLAQTLWAGVHGALSLPVTMDRIKFDPPQDIAQYMTESLITMISTKP